MHRFLVEEAAHGGDDRVESLDEAAHQRHAVALRASDQRPAGLRGRASPASRRGSACRARAERAQRPRGRRWASRSPRRRSPAAASRSSAKAQPSRSASGRTRSGSVSMITARSAPSDSAMTRAWLAPIAPAPTSAIRARAPMGEVSARRTSQIGDLQLRFDSAALSQQRDAAGPPSPPLKRPRRRAIPARREGRATTPPRSPRRTPPRRQVQPSRDPPVPGKRDQNVSEDLGEDEPDAAGREQREVEVAQLESVAEEDPGHGRAEEREPDDGNRAEPGS